MRKTALYTALSLALGSPMLAAAESELHPDHRAEIETIVVTALPLERTKLESAQPVDVLAGTKLEDRRGMTLGETLMNQPGVHSSAYGAGAGRPIIRGLGGLRVRILENGLSSADTAAQSDDHAVTVDPMLVERIEILRGPATLLYGSGAVGGVVNIVDNRIPERVPERLEGRFEARGDTVANERSGVFSLSGGGGNFAWHVDGSRRDADDYRIPGKARIEDDVHHHHGHDHGHGHEHDKDRDRRLENSFVESQSGTIGASWVGERGFLGMSFRAFDTEYGIPAPHAHEDDHDHGHDHERHGFLTSTARPLSDHGHDHGHEAKDEFVFVDMQQRRWDLRGGLDNPLPGFARGSLRMSYNDYEHQELKLDAHGHDHGHDHDHNQFTGFKLGSFQTRLELEREPIAGWRGAVGVQFENEELEAGGGKSFIPDGETRSVGLFILEEKRFGDFIFSAGARAERARVKLNGHDHGHAHALAKGSTYGLEHDHGHDHSHEDIDRRSFTAWSVSFGSLWHLSENWRSSLNYSRAQRAPSHTELFADGPHLATFSFELGDPRLGKETTNGLDFGVHYHSREFDFEVSLFYNDIRDFIFLADTGDTDHGLAVRQFRQDDAEFYGLESQAIWRLEENGFGHFDLRLNFDTVRGRLDTGGSLPRISPTRFGGGVDWRKGPMRSSVDLMRVQRQSNVAESESETPGYNMLNVQFGYQFDLGDMQMEAFAQGHNLLNEEARAHTSFLKNFAPLPGRNFRFGLRGRF